MPISLVLLPGLDGTGLLFQPLLARLPPTLDPVVVKYPGDVPLSYDELLPRVLAALPRSGEFVLLGESFSGPLALRVAATKPSGLIGVILCATFIACPWPILRPMIPLLARTPPFRLYLPYKRLKSRLGGYATLQHRALLAEISRIVRPRVIASRVRMVFRVNVAAALISCEVPILYMRCTHDLVVPGRNLQAIQKIRPDIQVATFDSSHMVLQRQPVQSAKAISDFAASLHVSPSSD